MTEEAPAEDHSSPVTHAMLDVPPVCEALYLANADAYFAYAQHWLDDETAEEAVHLAFHQIRNRWEELGRHGDLRQQAWAILRRVVASYVEESAVRREIAHVLAVYQELLEQQNAGVGLYEAIAKLSPRQFDVVVLRYLCKFPTDRIAWYLGVTASTVDYHCRRATRRLERDLAQLLKKDGGTK
ncbi:RNA polymerase sigma factor [Streptomyces sp. MAR4 CNY-716]